LEDLGGDVMKIFKSRFMMGGFGVGLTGSG